MEKIRRIVGIRNSDGGTKNSFFIKWMYFIIPTIVVKINLLKNTNCRYSVTD